MNTRVMISLIGALLLTVLSAGCTVDNCKENEDGCLGGKPSSDNKCQFDLVALNGKCVTPAEAQKNGNNGGDDGGSDGNQSMDACGGCDGTKQCDPKSKKCIDFCAIPDSIPGTGAAITAIPCTGNVKEVSTGELWDLTFEESCKNRCQLTCRWQKWFCNVDCAPGYCDEAARITECKAECNSGDAAMDLKCMNMACSAAHDRPCNQGMCPNGSAANCTGVTCTNACGGMDENSFDGFCDDGAMSNSLTNFCPFGTDCADCGPRFKAATPDDTRLLNLGEACPNNWRCDHTANYRLNPSWCIGVPGVDPELGLARCVPDCSVEARPCPDGFECKSLKLNPDRNGIKPMACVPIAEKQCM